MNWKPGFLRAFAICGVVLDACDQAKVDHSTVYRALKSDTEFAAGFDEARKMGAQQLVKEATRRAQEGVRRLKFYEGQMITVPSGKMLVGEDGTSYPEMVPYVEHEYSDRLLELLLKRHFPTEFRERQETPTSVTMNNTANLTIQVTVEQLAALQQREKLALEALVNGRC